MKVLSPLTGLFRLAGRVHRKLPPTGGSPTTRETFHSSILHQPKLPSNIRCLIEDDRDLIEPLNPLERQIKRSWKVVSSTEAKIALRKDNVPTSKSSSFKSMRLSSFIRVTKSLIRSAEAEVTTARITSSETREPILDKTKTEEEKKWVGAVDVELARESTRRLRKSQRSDGDEYLL